MGITNVSARWTGEALNFIGSDTKGNQFPMGGSNVSPSQMLLLGLAGCTGMDVVSILQKKRQDIADVEVQITGHQPDEYPKPYQQIEVKFIVKGVSQSLQQEVKISTSFETEG
jgi:putative redox protein